MGTLTQQHNISHPKVESAMVEKHTQLGDYLFFKHLNIHNGENLLNEALNEYYQALELKPDCPKLLGKLARVLIRQGKLQKAELMAQKAIDKDPTESGALYVLGYRRLKQGQVLESIQLLNQAIRHGGLHTSRFRFCLYYAYLEASRKSRNLLEGPVFLLLGYYQFFVGALLSKLEAEPSNFFSLLSVFPAIVRAYWKERMNDPDAALREYEAVYDQYPGMTAMMNLIANVYYRKGRWEKSKEWLRKAIDRDPLNEEGYQQLAHLLEETGKYEEAISTYEALLVLRPNDPHILCQLGNVHATLENFEQSLSYFKAAFQLGNNPMWRAVVAQTIGTIEAEIYHNAGAAQLAYQTALELNPKDVNTYIHLGILYFECQDFRNAQLIYEKAIALDPTSPRVHSNLGYLKWTSGNIHEAIRHYERAIEIDPYYDIAHNNLGVIYLDVLGNVMRAIELLEKASQLNENYALAYYNLGRAYAFIGKKKEALLCYQRAQILNELSRDLDLDELNMRIQQLFDSFDVCEPLDSDY